MADSTWPLVEAVPATSDVPWHSVLVRITHWITHLVCEEGWSFIAEWTGVPFSHLLDVVGTRPNARYVVYFSVERDHWDSIDMADALHPQTLLPTG